MLASVSHFPTSVITDTDVFLFKKGSHFELYEKLGAHLLEVNGTKGTHFAVWAPNAKKVCVVGDFNGWNKHTHPLYPRWDSSGIWENFIPGVDKGTLYKYLITSKTDGLELEKGDPFALYWEMPPKTASVVWDCDYTWNEGNWNEIRKKKNSLQSPISIYELHFGSWQRHVPSNEPLTYQQMANILPGYLQEMGFTHVEFMPMMEHPFYGSWGYQKVGYFAPSSRYGTPQDFMHLIDVLHQHEIGVYLDWVPSHFPSDEHGLAFFDGTHLFEHEDPRQGFHPDWGSYIFNYTRHEIRAFLISSAIFWLKKYHVDGLRVDAVSSMLYLNYSRENDAWIPNRHGGHENLEAIEFIQELNKYVYQTFPDVQMIAEESTAWPMVSKPTYVGGLGFGMKWNMGWMHDTLHYFSQDPVYRKFHHNTLLFSMYYFYQENFMLSLSHDEVVHGKGSLLSKMPGDDWQKFANLRLLYTYMYTHPGKKLLFMGSEMAPWREWNHETSLDWHLLSYAPHQGIKNLLQDLNHLYQKEKALYELEFQNEGFEWINIHSSNESIIAYLRKTHHKLDTILIVCHFTPVPRHEYCFEVPYSGKWEEIFNSDLTRYWGTGFYQNKKILAQPADNESSTFSIQLTLPPLSALIIKYHG